MKIPPSELPKHPSGSIYHLDLFPDELADNVILVGDPGRVNTISRLFDSIEVTKQNRELITHTGWFNGQRISVVSTGMGTDNIDIVLTELDALANIDLNTMTPKENHKSLNIIRIGTSGSLRPEVKPGAFVASKYGFGIDGLLRFYKLNDAFDEDLVKDFVRQTGWNELLPYPYCSMADDALLQKIAPDFYHGITASAPGFFGPQGRVVRAQLMYPDLNAKIENFNYHNLTFTNMEMECSAIYGLSKILGHKALTVCLIIANRVTCEAVTDYTSLMEKLVQTVLQRMTE